MYFRSDGSDTDSETSRGCTCTFEGDGSDSENTDSETSRGCTCTFEGDGSDSKNADSETSRYVLSKVMAVIRGT